MLNSNMMASATGDDEEKKRVIVNERIKEMRVNCESSFKFELTRKSSTRVKKFFVLFFSLSLFII